MTGKQPKRLPRPSVDEYGRTPLHATVISGDLEKVKKLLAEGAVADTQDDNGWTALHFAAQERRMEIVSALLDHGANPNLHDAHGNGPLWTAIVNARGDFSCIRALRAAGADSQHKNKHGKSPKDIAEVIRNGLEIEV
jgi:ankyrin repeat protein